MASQGVRGVRGHVFSNWAQTYSCQPELYFEPRDVSELKQVLCEARTLNKVVRVVGCGHSPSDIVCTNDYLVSIKHLNKILDVDSERHTVLVEAGMLLTDFHNQARSHGLALSVVGSVSELSLAGVVSTGTHGTGVNFGILSTYILELELVTSSGETVWLSRASEGDVFRAAVLSLGSLGVITKLRLQCEPSFNLRQTSYGAPLKDVIENLDVQLTSSDHFRFHWYPHTEDCVVTHATRTEQAVKRKSSWLWERLIGHHLIELLCWLSTFFSRLVPLMNRLYHRINSQHTQFVDLSHNVFTMNCLFKQYVMEWSVPVEKTGVVLYELRSWLEMSGFMAHYPVEVRFVKSDDILLSPAHGRTACYVNVIMYRPYGKFVEHAVYWRAFKEIMMRHGGRPHWAKDHLMTARELRPLYPEWDTFCAIRRRMDPGGMFLNDNLRTVLGD